MTTLNIPQGTTWAIEWPVVDADGDPIDVTTWTVRSHVRASVKAAETLHTWTTAGGNVDTGLGFIRLRVTPATSSAWTWRHGHYDVELVSPSGDVTRVAEGTVRISPEITR